MTDRKSNDDTETIEDKGTSTVREALGHPIATGALGASGALAGAAAGMALAGPAGAVAGALIGGAAGGLASGAASKAEEDDRQADKANGQKVDLNTEDDYGKKKEDLGGYIGIRDKAADISDKESLPGGGG